MTGEWEGVHRSVVVVDGGQAGLSMSHCLTRTGVDHVVFERERVGHEWRERRWDSFCLVTPNWQCQLPGFGYPGGDPDGFMPRDEIVAYLEDYARSFDVPIAEGVAVTRLRQQADGRFTVTTSAGTLTADQIVVATGPYQTPRVPRIAERLPVFAGAGDSVAFAEDVRDIATALDRLLARQPEPTAGRLLAQTYTWRRAALAHRDFYTTHLASLVG